MDYQIVSMRFGLDGKYASRDEVAQRFGWSHADGGPRYHEYKAAEQLHAVADKLVSLTEIS